MSETFGVRGRVLGEDGQPLAGVRVLMGPNLPDVETDADGRFSVDQLRFSEKYWMWAREDDCYTPFAWVTAESEVELRMRRGAMVVVRVLAAGLPLAGTTVALARTIRNATDERGLATFRGIPPESLTGCVLASGWATARFFLTVEPGDTFVERTVDLERGAEVSGRVLDLDGAPAGDARVLLMSASHEHFGDATPDADGMWSVAMPAGRYRVWATACRRRSSEIEIDCDGQSPHRDLVLRVDGTVEPTYGRVAGVVVDEQGQPAANAQVRVVTPASRKIWEWFGRTDETGHFQSEELGVTGAVDIVTNWDVRPRAEPHHAASVGDRNVTVVLPRGATLVGRVVHGGVPLPYFGLRPDNPDQRMPRLDSSIAVRSDDGRFALPHIPPGTWNVRALAPGMRLATSRAVTITANETVDLGDIEVVRGYRVSGIVRDRDGKPVADARVVVGRLAMVESNLSRLEKLFYGRHETRTDATGFYLLEGLDDRATLPPLPEIIHATHPVAGLSKICELPHEQATLDFTLLGRGRIEGVVPGGALAVVGVGEPMLARSVSVNKSGRFGINVPPGDYEIEVRVSKDLISMTTTVIDGETAILVMPSSNL